ncbi:MAG: sensor histidine kinase, partial [Clostridium sp.]
LNIKKTIEGVMKGDLKTKIVVKSKDEIGELEETFNLMITWLDESIDEIKEKEKQKRVAELSFLQAQINPHFIYNTLTGIRALVSMNKNEDAEEMLYKFTKLLRNILPKANELISLEEEIKIIREYIELQEFRYPNSFRVLIDIEKTIKDVKVPLLILQPLVENAIFYSMESEKNDGVIEIRGYEKENSIYIEIEDNGKGMDREKIISVFNKKESINRVGLINVHERVQLNYGVDYGISIESNEGKGTKVIVRLPKEWRLLC